jgi:siroheme synthase (precorrin-2 oxidase/ferrochelatase)
LAISTSGASPALAGLLAQVLRQLLPESRDGDLTALRRERHLIRSALDTPARRTALVAQAVQFLEDRPQESN